MTEAPKLKPCPFCGGEGYLEPQTPTYSGSCVECLDCEARVGPYRVINNVQAANETAIDAWNRRDDAEVQRLVAEARAERVVVKPLEWLQRSHSGGGHRVASPDPYQLWADNGGSGAPDDPFVKYENYAVFDPNMKMIGEFVDTEEAKAAAQADYERRILSALSDAPPRQVTPQEADVERMAIAMWQDEATRAGTNGVAARRTPRAWLDQAPELQEKWRRYAHAALRALTNEETKA